MKKSLLHLSIVAAVIEMTRVLGFHTQDISFQFRMGAGFPGDVNRTHPASIVAGLMNQNVQAPRLFGDPVIIDSATQSYRGIVAGDTSTFACDGIVVRPYPTQQTVNGMTATIGTGAPSTQQSVDILSDGFIMVKCNNSGAPNKGDPVYVYTAVNSGGHVQGGLEAAAGANLSLISNAFWNGPVDASGIGEIRVTASRI